MGIFSKTRIKNSYLKEVKRISLRRGPAPHPSEISALRYLYEVPISEGRGARPSKN